MAVTINLPSEAEQKLRAAAGRRGETLEAYLEWLAIQSAGSGARSVAKRAPEERVAELRAWAASHAPVTHFVDDSRASIYEGRGE
ncbi:MAG TPA: hypothetical protein VF278_06055 [Pirellulales bacterium]